jgi:hypothetical protein
MAQLTAIYSITSEDGELPSHLNNLGVSLGIQFEQTGVSDDLNKAIAAFSKGIELVPEESPISFKLRTNLCFLLARRFEYTGSLSDLNRGISNLESLKGMSDDIIVRAAHLSNLN